MTDEQRARLEAGLMGEEERARLHAETKATLRTMMQFNPESKFDRFCYHFGFMIVGLVAMAAVRIIVVVIYAVSIEWSLTALKIAWKSVYPQGLFGFAIVFGLLVAGVAALASTNDTNVWP